MDNLEHLMYSVMTNLSSMNAPIVFKGALVLKAIQYKYGNPSGLERETHDIDGDWVGEPPTMNYLRDLIQTAVYNSGYSNINVVAVRDYSDRRSAGFEFYDITNGDRVLEMDLSVRSNNSIEQYSFVSGISFYGQSVIKVLVDKIIPVSQKVVMRRIKDVIDLYILSYIWRGSVDSVYNYIAYLGKDLGDFSNFTGRLKELEHAYSKYRNKCSILPFNIVYNRVYLFLIPIINKKKGVYWDGCKWS